MRNKCTKCGKIFTDEEIAVIKFTEYAGASLQEEYTCPFCGAGTHFFDDVE